MKSLIRVRTLLFLLVVSYTCFGQEKPLIKNQQAISSIKITLDLIYNFEFGKALERIENGSHQIGDHPANYILRALVIYWKDRPLAAETQPYIDFESHLKAAIEKSEPFLENDEFYYEGVFYHMAAHGLLAELYSEEGVGLKALNEAKKAYKYLKEGMEMNEEFPDFYFSTGLYNYYREKYPELRPFYKSFMWLFRSGDMDRGLRQLVKARNQAIFTGNEAVIYLFHIYQRYENESQKALPHVEYLVNHYPGNTRFKSLYAEVLVSMGSYDKAEILITKLIDTEKKFHKLAGVLFSAVIFERRNKLGQAEKKIDQALVIHDSMDKNYYHYLSMIYAVKARIADRRGNTDQAREYYRTALKSDPYVPVKQEALGYLKK